MSTSIELSFVRQYESEVKEAYQRMRRAWSTSTTLTPIGAVDTD